MPVRNWGVQDRRPVLHFVPISCVSWPVKRYLRILIRLRNYFMSCMAVEGLNLLAPTFHGKRGVLVALPNGNEIRHYADSDTAFYLVHDEPLLRYLGVTANTKRFKPTLYTSEDSLRELDIVRQEADAVNRSRISVLLANKAMDQTLTVTHTLWAIAGGTVQSMPCNYRTGINPLPLI